MAESVIIVVSVDDEPNWRALVSARLERTDGIELVGTAAGLAEARAVIAATRPQVLLLDLHLRDGNGIDFVRELADYDSPPAVVILSATRPGAAVREALDAGAVAYLDKARSRAEMTTAIRAAAAGRTLLGEAVVEALVTEIRASGGGA